jgi:hypothetical protein
MGIFKTFYSKFIYVTILVSLEDDKMLKYIRNCCKASN